MMEKGVLYYVIGYYNYTLVGILLMCSIIYLIIEGKKKGFKKLLEEIFSDN